MKVARGTHKHIADSVTDMKMNEELGNVMAIPILWRTTKERYSLQGEVCPECERVVFPPRRLCPYCGRAHEVHEAKEEKTQEALRYEFSFVLPTNVEFSAAGDD
jgi:uncharacterized OB-fold protein